jgi:DNA polymerase/3'-5' exonuclease PolX
MKAEAVDLLIALGLAMRQRGDEGRAKAYLRAANQVARQADFEALVEQGKLRSIPGIGPSIERTLARFLATGERPAWAPAGQDALRAAIDAFAMPEGFVKPRFPARPTCTCTPTGATAPSPWTRSRPTRRAWASRPSASATTAAACASRAA